MRSRCRSTLGRFDAATLIHVGMNIGNKAGVFTEIGRVLKPGGRFGIYDIMRMGEGELPYPMPWAATPDTSFVEPPESYRRALAHAGFEIEKEQSRRDLALTLGREMRGNVEKSVAPRMGLHLLMGSGGQERLGNVMMTLERGVIAPIEIIARRL